MNNIVDEALAKIDDINEGYATITRDMFAAIVVGTNAEDVSRQVQDKLGADIYQVIGPADYTAQFENASIKIVLDEAGEEQMETVSMAKALKLSLELVPAEGNIAPNELQELDTLFSQDASGNFHVAPATYVFEVEDTARKYAIAVGATDIGI